MEMCLSLKNRFITQFQEGERSFNNIQEVVEEKVFESEDERNSFYDTYNF